MTGEFLVVGLGRFGTAVALTLVEEGQAVLVVDSRQDAVDAVAAEVDSAVCADATDERVLEELQPERAACAVVAIGIKAVEASILTTALLHQRGVPRIVARAVSDVHGRVLRAVGASELVNPEGEMGVRVGRRLARPNVFERIELGEDADLAEIVVPESLVGKTLVELDMRRRFGVSVVAVRRGGKVRATLDGSERLESRDVLVAIGKGSAIRNLAGMA